MAPSDEVLRDGAIFDWLRSAQAEGLIRHFGASVETVEEGLLCLKEEGVFSLQVIFNIFRQKLVTELLPQAQTKGVGIIVRLPPRQRLAHWQIQRGDPVRRIRP